MSDSISATGTDLGRVSYSLQHCYRDRVPAVGHRTDHVDSCWSCWLLDAGRVELTWADGAVQASAGSWVLAGPGCRRSQQFSADARILSVRFQIDWRGPAAWRQSPLPAVCAAVDVPGLQARGEALLAATGEAPVKDDLPRTVMAQSRRQAALAAFVVPWLQAYDRCDRPVEILPVPDARIAAVIESLDAVVGLGPVPYDDLQAASGLSRSQLDRLLPRHLGCSARAYLEAASLRQAEAWLLAGDLSVKEVAGRLGFHDGSHFAKWFRRQTGVAPRSWRHGIVV